MSERKILNSWKEIAGYLGRGVRTVQRYEVDHGFPVRRIQGKNRTAVMAFTDEIDTWLGRWHTRLEPNDGRTPDSVLTPLVLQTNGTAGSDPFFAAASANRSPRSKCSRTVLIVEDENAAVERLQSVLNSVGAFNFEVYHNPGDAIKRLQQAVKGEADMPCLIVLDFELPDSSGFAVLTYYRMTPELRATTPLIVWSVLDSVTSREMAIWMGAKRFISKDTGESTLLKSLTSVLQEHDISLSQTSGNA